MSEATATGTFQALQAQLQAAIVEAYGHQERLDAAKERIKSLRVAISGVDLGKRLEAETAKQDVAAEA